MNVTQPDLTPAALGYRFPAEWEPHAATWLSWPHNQETWPGKFAPIPKVWTELARAICEFEPVHILAGGKEAMAQARSLVGDLPDVHLHDISTNDAWIRDHGPMFLQGPRGAPPALVDWEYNAWGGKYPPFDADNRVPGQIAEALNCRRFQPGAVMEGGAVDANGQGAILASEECLLNPNRNPTLSREDMEQLLRDYCGATTVLWLGGAIVGDDTDGHVDQLARFVNPTTLVAAVEEDPEDENYAPLQQNLNRLRAMSLPRETSSGSSALEVIPLPMPRPIHFRGQRLPAGYVNFYIANGVVVVPQYDDRADEAAVDILAGCFPDREIRGLYAVDLVLGLGAIHCITNQQPAA